MAVRDKPSGHQCGKVMMGALLHKGQEKSSTTQQGIHPQILSVQSNLLELFDIETQRAFLSKNLRRPKLPFIIKQLILTRQQIARHPHKQNDWATLDA